jgi:hypothetical protein
MRKCIETKRAIGVNPPREKIQSFPLVFVFCYPVPAAILAVAYTFYTFLIPCSTSDSMIARPVPFFRLVPGRDKGDRVLYVVASHGKVDACIFWLLVGSPE